MPDDPGCICVVVPLVFLDEIQGAGQRDAANVFFDLFFAHADSVVRHGQSLFLLVQCDANSVVFTVGDVPDFSQGDQTLELCNGIRGVGNDFTQENILIGVQPFFDNRENMLCFDGNTALFFCFIDFTHLYIPHFVCFSSVCGRERTVHYRSCPRDFSVRSFCAADPLLH